jgi:hypothetical protein
LNPNKTQKTSFKDKLKELKNLIKKENLGVLENEIDLQDVQGMHHLRNAIQHRGRNVAVDDYTDYVLLSKSFISVLVRIVFKTHLDEIKQISLIKNKELHKRLKWAYEDFAVPDKIMALAWANNALISMISHASSIYGFEEKIMLFDFMPPTLDDVLEPISYSKRGVDSLTSELKEYKSIDNLEEKIAVLDRNLSKIIETVDVYSSNLNLLYETQLGTLLCADPRDYLQIKYHLDKVFDVQTPESYLVKVESSLPDDQEIRIILDQIITMAIRFEKIYPDIVIPKIKRNDLVLNK